MTLVSQTKGNNMKTLAKYVKEIIAGSLLAPLFYGLVLIILI